jgi:hypothetical protein
LATAALGTLALVWAEQALALDPGCQLRWHYLGMTHYALRRYNEAVAAFRRHPALRAAVLGREEETAERLQCRLLLGP